MAGAKLKVYRTAIGFHDAYVAAPSQKAALAAWGSAKDLFARGAAELVTDEALTAEPLAAPGTVVKRLRGSAEEQIAALPPDPPQPKRPRRERGEKASARRGSSASKPKPPRPSRAALEAAEQAIADAEQRHAVAMNALREREEAIARERHALEREQEDRLAALIAARERAKEAYRAALANWSAGD